MQGADSDTWLDEIVPLLFGKAYREANAKAMRAFARSRERRPPNPAAVDIQWNAYERFDSWERLPQLRSAVLCLAGAEDSLCDPRNAERLAERLPMAELCVIEGGGHSVHIEMPKQVNEAVAAFLGV
jgi:pimeloyl-ACP methyl ester carboxylesterase